MNPGLRILPLPRDNGLRMNGRRSEQLLVLRMGNYPWRRMNHKFGQRHEDVERNIIFPEKTWNCTWRKKRTSENHSNGTLERHPLPQVWTYQQAAYQPTNTWKSSNLTWLHLLALWSFYLYSWWKPQCRLKAPIWYVFSLIFLHCMTICRHESGRCHVYWSIENTYQMGAFSLHCGFHQL